MLMAINARLSSRDICPLGIWPLVQSCRSWRVMLLKSAGAVFGALDAVLASTAEKDVSVLRFWLAADARWLAAGWVAPASILMAVPFDRLNEPWAEQNLRQIVAAAGLGGFCCVRSPPAQRVRRAVRQQLAGNRATCCRQPGLCLCQNRK